MRTYAMRRLLGVLCATTIAWGAAPAYGAAPEPDFVLVPGGEFSPVLEGPCGVAVSSSGTFYVANYYRDSVDIYSSSSSFITQHTAMDPLYGPCGLGLDSGGRLYVNYYHRDVEQFTPVPGGLSPPVVFGSPYPTGVAVDPITDEVYVNNRTHVSAYDATGAPLLDGPDPLRIGAGSLGDGYGLAVSGFPATAGRIYVPDNADDTVKVYDPSIDKEDPVQTIAGPPGGFGSLRDSAVAVDRVTGEIYVADTLAYPQYTEKPEATIRIFEADGTYKGRLKYNVIDGSPPGLAVDNSEDEHGQPGLKQGRVYVTSGNTIQASVYAYPPGSGTNQSAPASYSLALSSSGSGSGSLSGDVAGVYCEAVCQAEVRAAAKVTLTATPDPGSAFLGWSGAGCSGVGACTVSMNQAHSVTAQFGESPQPPTPSLRPSVPTAATSSVLAQNGNLRVAVSGKLAPKRLPRRGAAPISVSVEGEITTTDQSLPSQLKRMRIELNREGRLDTQGLPPCNYEAIQPGSSQRALSACRDSLVGKGSFTANITLAGQEPYPTAGKLLLFHSVEKGKPVLYGHIYSPKPFATSFVIVFAVQRISKGTYGIALNAPLPPAMDAWGRLTGLQMTLERRYSHKGRAHSFLSAGCSAPEGFAAASFSLARAEFSFEDGRKLRSTLISECRVRG